MNPSRQAFVCRLLDPFYIAFAIVLSSKPDGLVDRVVLICSTPIFSDAARRAVRKAGVTTNGGIG